LEAAEVTLRRLLGAAALVGLTVALALVADLPDLGRSLDLLTGHTVTGATEFAFIALLCWVMLALMAILAVVDVLRRAARQPGVFTPWLWSLVILTAGATLLVAGIARHQSPYRVCCTSPDTAHQAEQLVR
jgi:heme/copper-type cytochrome/quinol oxidase subunit 1